ncbi:MAG: hypothetical protein IT372_15115 [Polyangiaceae bacterium]|nr:hypothetical protein [Polyangiaceae bacterium]
MKRLPLVPVAAAVALAAACSSNPEPEVPPGDLCATGQAPPGQFCPPPVTTASPVPTTTATTPTPAPPSTAATPIAPMAAMAATPVMQGLAAQEAPGMAGDVGPFAGQFQEGQVLEQQMNIAAGKCYTIIGIGIGVQELDIQLTLVTAPGVPPIVLAQDSTTGPQAVIGGKQAGCFRNPTPVAGTGKILMKATKGTGIAVAQVFSK